MKRNNKKGFTIVELVIVIAVIGILTAILVPVFINLTNKANEASDNSLVKNLNTALKMVENDPSAEDEDTHQKLSGKNNTMQDVILDLKYEGYYLENLVAKSGQDLLWDATKNEFFLGTETTVANVNYWQIVKEVPATANQKYSYYAGKNFNTTVPNLKYGFDAGDNGGITLNYVGPGANPGQTARIRTNGGTLTINAANDEVTHYGQVDYVDIIAVKSASYEERGTTSLIKVAKGNIALNKDSKVGEIHFAKTNNSFTDIKVTLTTDVKLPDLSRDPVGTSGLDNVLICEVVTSGTSEYYWLNAKGTIQDGEVLVSSTIDGAKTAATAENSTAVAIANAKVNDEVVDNGATVKPATEMTPEEVTEATASGATKTFAEIDSKEKLLAFRDAWNAGKLVNGTFKLTTNIDISGDNWYPIGSWEFPFNGTFEGNNNTINGLYANSSDADHVGTYANNSTVGFGETFGFFGIVGGDNVTIQNLSFSNVNIDIYDGKDVGAVVGYAPSNSKFKAASRTTGDDSLVDIEPYKSSSTFAGKWENDTEVGTHAIKLSGIIVSGSIKAKASVAGIAGKIYSSGKVEVLNCTNNANITGGSNTSGVAGYIHYSSDITVSGCTNTGTIKLTGGAGIVNFNDLSNKKITNNTNSGNVVYNAAYTKTSSNSYSWDFIAGGIHNTHAYTEYHGNTNTGKFYIQDNEEAENTKGVLIVDAGETVTISSASEYTDILVNGTLNINAATDVYGSMWVSSSGTLNVNAPLRVDGTDGYLKFSNSSVTIAETGSINATAIVVPNNFTLTNNGTVQIRVSSSFSKPNNGLNKSNLTIINNGTFIGDSNVFYGDELNFTNNGTYQGNMILTGSATVLNTENGKFEAHGGNGIDFRGGSGSFINHATSPFGAGFDGVSIWVAGTYTVEGRTPHLGAGVTNLELTHEGNVWTATNK